MKKKFILHPFIFSIYPILFLLSHNISKVTRVSYFEIIFLIIISLFITYVILILLKIALKNTEKASILTTFLLLIFYSFGHIKGIQIEEILNSKQKYLIPLLAITFIVAAFIIIKFKKDNSHLNKVLNFISLILLIIPTFNITIYTINPGNVLVNENKDLEIIKTTEDDKKIKRDIYYIILDGYTSSGSLKRYLNFDNSEFNNFLLKKNFYIADKSRSNYSHTNFSIPSALNMEYINLSNSDKYTDNQIANLTSQIARNNKIKNHLQSLGYKYIMIPSRYSLNWMPEENLDFDWLNTPHNFFYGDFLDLFYKKTVLKLIRNFRKGAYHQSRRREILSQLTFLEKDVHKISGPKFVFAHILSPHPPYVFDSAGKPAKTKSTDWHWEYPDEYLNQIVFLNRRVKNVINKILTKSKISPIIIIQGDHGPPLFGVEENERNIKLKTSILNAYFLPKMNNDLLYNSITPVNTFRIIFNHYFNANYELLKDDVYFFVEGSVSRSKLVTSENYE